jgi:hypothetical protein
MSIFSPRFFSRSPLPPLPAPGIRSATGLPRAVIAAHYRNAGLFGRDSDLSPLEQCIVRHRLDPLPGVPVPACEAGPTCVGEPTLRLLSDHVDALVAGRSPDESASLLRRWGFTAAALSEVERTVRNVQDIFGLRARPARADVHECVMPRTAAIARAA